MTENSWSRFLPQSDYPPSIRGSLRLILQLKDYFIAAFDTIERYRSMLLECQHGFSRSLAVHNLSIGLASLRQLREELREVDKRVEARVTRNRALRHFLRSLTSRQASPVSNQLMRSFGALSRMGIPFQKSKVDAKGQIVCDGPEIDRAPEAVLNALHGGLQNRPGDVDVDKIDIPPEIDISSTVTESGAALLSVIDFYRGFYFLQMHFQIIMCQAANYAMPVVTGSMGIGERLFGWPTAPAFGMARAAGPMCDKLMELHNEVFELARRLYDCLQLVQAKRQQDRVIEAYFRQQTAAQEAASSALLRCLQIRRSYADKLESQNDRLTGIAVKLDRRFPKSNTFHEFTNPEGIYDFQGSMTNDDSASDVEVNAVNPGDAGSNSALLWQHQESTKKAIPLALESINQLLLGSDSVAPGLKVRHPDASIHSPLREVTSRGVVELSAAKSSNSTTPLSGDVTSLRLGSEEGQRQNSNQNAHCLGENSSTVMIYKSGVHKTACINSQLRQKGTDCQSACVEPSSSEVEVRNTSAASEMNDSICLEYLGVEIVTSSMDGLTVEANMLPYKLGAETPSQSEPQSGCWNNLAGQLGPHYGAHKVPVVQDNACLPSWAKQAFRKADSPQTEEELLLEPKRCELSRSIVENRQSLVESILKADEDRLSEMLKVLLRRK